MPRDRNSRLEQDYREMLQLQNRSYLSWIVTKGEPPYAEEYLLDIRVRTYAYRMDENGYKIGVIDRCAVKVTLWPSYPDTAPHVRMLNIPPVFHPDWYSRGVYSPPQPWRREGSLKDHLLRMIATLQYDPKLIEGGVPANFKALEWYQKNRGNASLFPSDTTPLSENDAEETAAAARAADFTQIVDSRSFHKCPPDTLPSPCSGEVST